MLAETKAACGWFPMKIFTQNDPLTDADLDRLGDFLKSCKGGRAMNVEQLDGFFAALIAGPETVMPSEYYAEVFGGEMSDACEFGSLDEAKDILGLMMRHWNTIAGTLLKGDVYVPILLEGDDGTAHGNDWARGFMRGMHMRHDGWAALVIPRCGQPNWPDYSPQCCSLAGRVRSRNRATGPISGRSSSGNKASGCGSCTHHSSA
jgi:yecA family protein